MTMNYLTSPLSAYDPVFRERAGDLSQRIVNRIGPHRMKERDGSYSILNASNDGVAAKIIMVKGKDRAGVPDGVYILINTFPRETIGIETIAVGPWWDSRYAYFRLAADQDLDEIANFILAFAAAPAE